LSKHRKARPFRLAGLSFPLAALALPLGAWSPSAALSIKRLYPADGAAGQCLDTPLRMVLSGKAVNAWNGSIRIRNLATGEVVKTWEVTRNPGNPNQASVAAAWPWKDNVGDAVRNVWPVVVDSVPEYLAEVRLPQRLLQPDTRYQVEVDGGILKGADGSAFSGVAAGAWSFTTGKRPVSKSRVVVAEDNSGDVCSVQGGVDLAPSGSSTPVQVLVRAGHYREMVSATKKDRLELYGEGAGKTSIRYFNSNNLNEGSDLRCLVRLAGNGIRIRALSLTNTVEVTAGQAEALNIQGDTNVVADVLLRSHQDTWLNKGGRVYVQDATLEGSVDFVWGYSPVFFKRCTLTFTRAGSVIVQPRNGAGTHGYVFEGCAIKSRSAAFTGSRFARDGGTSYPDGEAVFLNTTISGNVLAESPWTIGEGMDASKLNFCEYQSRNPDGSLISVTDAQRKRHQCTADMARQLAEPANVLAGWKPSVPPLESVFALFGSATQAFRAPARAGAARLVASGGGQVLEISRPGAAIVREIFPDGASRILFRCAAPCSERIGAGPAVPSWLEIEQPGSGGTFLIKK
jgi:pectin methylesterase-like acyl-CoA thioesterase